MAHFVTNAFTGATSAYDRLFFICNEFQRIGFQPQTTLVQALRLLKEIKQNIQEKRSVPTQVAKEARNLILYLQEKNLEKDPASNELTDSVTQLLSYLEQLEAPHFALSLQSREEGILSVLDSVIGKWQETIDKDSGLASKAVYGVVESVNRLFTRTTGETSRALVRKKTKQELAAEHPLMKLSCLMGSYFTERSFTTEQRLEFEQTVKDLLSKSRLCKPFNIPKFTSCVALWRALTSFLKERLYDSNNREPLLDILYVEGQDQGFYGKDQSAVAQQEAALDFLEKINPMEAFPTIPRDQSGSRDQLGSHNLLIDSHQPTLDMRKGHVLWIAVAFFEEGEEVKRLFQIIQAADCQSPKQLFESLECAITFYEKNPQSHLDANNHKLAQERFKNWCHYLEQWIELHISFHDREQLFEEVKESRRLMELMRPLEATEHLKNSFENTPIGKARWCEVNTASPIDSLDACCRELTPTSANASKQHPITKEAVETQKNELVETLSFYATFEALKFASGEPKEAKKLYQQVLQQAKNQVGAHARKEAFFRGLEEHFKHPSIMQKQIGLTLATWAFSASSLVSHAILEALIEAFRKLPKAHLTSIAGVTNSLQDYLRILQEWADSNRTGTRQQQLGIIAKGEKYRCGLQPSIINQKLGNIVIDRFLPVFSFCGFRDSWRERIHAFSVEKVHADLDDDHMINRLGRVFKQAFAILPYGIATITHAIVKVVEFSLNTAIKKVVKWYITNINVIDQLSTNASDKLSHILPLFLVIQRQLEETESHQKNEEVAGETVNIVGEKSSAKEIYSEMIENALEVIDKDQYLTRDSYNNRPSDPIPFLQENDRRLIMREVRDKIMHVGVPQITRIIQSLFSEGRVNEILQTILEKANDYFSEDKLPTLTPDEATALANSHNKERTALSPQEIEVAVREKITKAENAITAALTRIVENSIDHVAQQTLTKFTMSFSKKLMTMIDWIEKNLLSADQSQYNIFNKLLSELESNLSPTDAHEKVRTVFLKFLRQFKANQWLLEGETTYNSRMLNTLNHRFIDTFLSPLSQKIKEWGIDVHSTEKKEACTNLIKDFRDSQEQREIYLQALASLKKAEKHKIAAETKSLLGSGQQAAKELLDSARPALVKAVNYFATLLLQSKTKGTLASLQNRVLFELLLDHQKLIALGIEPK